MAKRYFALSLVLFVNGLAGVDFWHDNLGLYLASQAHANKTVYQEKTLRVLIHDPSVKREHFYQECAGKSYFRSLCSKLGSTVRKWVIAVALHYAT